MDFVGWFVGCIDSVDWIGDFVDVDSDTGCSADCCSAIDCYFAAAAAAACYPAMIDCRCYSATDSAYC